MEPATTETVPATTSGRGLVLLGIGLMVLGMAGYAVQLFALHLLFTPWYMAAMTSVGALLVLLAILRKRTVVRILTLLLLLLVGAGQWGLLLHMRLPAYTGPVSAGIPFPAFVTHRADGSTFSQRDLGGDKNDVLVFFRGRW
jgi:hypothetical protein